MVLSVGLDALGVLLLSMVAARGTWEARKSGTLELPEPCTPVSAPAIVQGHWQAIWNKLRLPLSLFILVPIALFVIAWGFEAGGRSGMPWLYLLAGTLPQLGVRAGRLPGGLLARALVWGNDDQAQPRSRAGGFVDHRHSVGDRRCTHRPDAGFVGPPHARHGGGMDFVVLAGASIVKGIWLVGLILWARRRLFNRLRDHVTLGAKVVKDRWWWPRKPSLPTPASA